jgi:predicted Fe-Mo cluster-binding NifX family protein
MKICIPTEGEKGWDDTVADHFGRAPTFTIIDTENNEITVIPNQSEHMGGQGLPAEILSQQGVRALLCQGCGRRAIQFFEQAGVTVYLCAQGTVRSI